MSFSEAQIEKAVREAMEKVDEKNDKRGNTGRALVLQTPWREEPYQMGTVFNAKTVRGGTNYVIFMMVNNGWAYYCHADRAKKVPVKDFIDLIGSGDLEFVPKDKQDPEKKSLAVLGLMAMANGMGFEDYMKIQYNEGSGSDANRYAF